MPLLSLVLVTGHPEMMATVLLCQVSHIPLSLLSQRLVGCPGTVATISHPARIPLSLLSLVPGTGGTSWNSVPPVPCPRWDVLGWWLLSHSARCPQIPLSFLSLVPWTGGNPGTVATVPPCPNPTVLPPMDWWDILGQWLLSSVPYPNISLYVPINNYN